MTSSLPTHGSASLELEGASRIARGLWRVADPKITLASMSSIFLGACLAARSGPLSVGWLTLTVLGIFFIEAAKNTSGEIFDWDSGADLAIEPKERSPFSGGKRLLVDHLMTRRQAAITALVFYVLGSGVGLAIVALREPWVLALGVVGVGLAFFYHAPPARLSYRGLGELAVAAAYGPLVACGTYLVQRHALSWPVLLASLLLGLAITAFLWICEFPDARADALAQKRTLVVRLGRRRAAEVFPWLFALTYAGVILLPLAGLPLGVWLGLAGLVPSVRAAKRLIAAPEDVPSIVPAQGWTLLAFVLLALGMGVGALL